MLALLLSFVKKSENIYNDRYHTLTVHMSILFEQIFINWLSFLTVKKAIRRQHVQKLRTRTNTRKIKTGTEQKREKKR